MKTPSFFEGVGIALITAIGGSVLFTFLPHITGTATAIKLMISIITLGYLWYLFRRSPERIGRLTIVAGWLLATVITWLWSPSLILFALFNAGTIWLVRSLYFYNGVLISITDLLLTLLGFASAYWAMINTQSLFLSIWCFFLVQALFPSLLSLWNRTPTQTNTSTESDDAFTNAHKIAEATIHKLASTKTSL